MSHNTIPPVGNNYMPPNPAYSHPPPPGWRQPTGIPPPAIQPLQLWQNVIYDCIRRALEDHDRTRTSSKPVGLSREDAETLLSSFHRTLRSLIQKELSSISTMLNQNKTSSEPAATSSGITPEETRVIGQEIQRLGDTLSLEIKALSQVLPLDLPPVLSECKLMDVTASWSSTAQTLKGAIQSLERTVEDLRNMLTRDRAKYWSATEALGAEQLSASQRDPGLDLLGYPTTTAQEIKACLQEIRGVLYGARETKLRQQHLQRTGPVTRAHAKALNQKKNKRGRNSKGKE